MRKIKRKQLERKIRVAAVSYLNTLPLTYGFENGQLKDQVEFVFEYPSKVASMLLENQVDIGLVPVAVIPQLKESYIISDVCIGASGDVASVCLFSDVPLQQIREIYLDYQSRTSVALLQVLCRDYWKINPVFIPATPGYEDKINGTTAGLVIGDRAFIQRKKSAFIYDLAGAWIEMTGLPFVFAAWVANKQLPESFIKAFNKASSEGLNHIDEIVSKQQYPEYDLHKYYTNNIDYRLDEKKREGLDLFLKILSEKVK